ncbi:antibiotic biosynthesis monooxygenase [Aspergillus bertholletiae]|uniref:Antibiotic biosynthesis monooxygenase n=1 Tax=Aspergillus bertholletiae TaxID=1226010 RepID=A0A5N7BII9_9EURO|nr:antibiotic biosynthesis monooxygenase [Aspergillus bertholletiae]
MGATFIDINPRTPLRKQLEEKPEAGSCVLVNTFHIPPGKMDEAFIAWKIDADLAKKQPGFILTQLHRGINGSDMMLNYAVWESTAALKAYYDLPEFQASLENYPDGTECRIALYRKEHVNGVCLA